MGRLSHSDAVLVVAGPLIILFLVDGFFRTQLHTLAPAAFWAFDALKFIALPSIGLYFLYHRYSIAPRQYGVLPVARSEAAHFVGVVAFLTLFLSAAYFAPTVLFWYRLEAHEAAPFTPSLVPDGLLGLPVAFYLAATAGITEEILCRGLPLLYVSLRFPGRLPAGAYCFVTALLFATTHWENGANEVIGTFIYGLFTSAFYLQLRTLTPLMAAHALGDLWWFWGRTAF